MYKNINNIADLIKKFVKKPFEIFTLAVRISESETACEFVCKLPGTGNIFCSEKYGDYSKFAKKIIKITREQQKIQNTMGLNWNSMCFCIFNGVPASIKYDDDYVALDRVLPLEHLLGWALEYSVGWEPAWRGEDFAWTEKSNYELYFYNLSVENKMINYNTFHEEYNASFTDSGENSEEHQNTYQNLPEIAAILTNNNEKVVADAKRMALGFDCFYERYNDWCDEMGFKSNDNMLQVFAYWLAGYGNSEYTKAFGSYNDWKDSIEDVLDGIDEAVINLGYPIYIGGLDEFDCDEELFMPDAMNAANIHLNDCGYTLIYLDTDGDCYHFFIAPNDKLARLKELGDEIGFKFEK